MNETDIKKRIQDALKEHIKKRKIKFAYKPASRLQRQARKLNTQDAWDALLNELSVAEFIDITAAIIENETYFFKTLEDLLQKYRSDDQDMMSAFKKAKQKGLMALFAENPPRKMDFMNKLVGHVHKHIIGRGMTVRTFADPEYIYYIDPDTAETDHLTRSRVMAHEMAHYLLNTTGIKIEHSEDELFAIAIANFIEGTNSMPRKIHEATFFASHTEGRPPPAPSAPQLNVMFNNIAQVKRGLSEKDADIEYDIRSQAFIKLLKMEVTHFPNLGTVKRAIDHLDLFDGLTLEDGEGISAKEALFLENLLDIAQQAGTAPQSAYLDFQPPSPKNGNVQRVTLID